MSRNLLSGLLFIILILGLFFFLGLDKVFFLGPTGIHFMRQTDSLSFASQYFNNGFNFFTPQLYNLKNIDGKAACEFPIIYYLTSIIYYFIGKKVFILKLLHLIIVYIGVYFVYKLSYQILKDYIYAILVTLFLFTSTVFNYYSFNYLPDSAALGFVLIGWYYIFEYNNNSKQKSLLISLLFFTLGGLIKVTYLINPLAIIFFSLITLFVKKTSFGKNQERKYIIKYGLISVVIVAIWNIYMIIYNAANDSNSFNTSALPIWDLSKENISIVWLYINKYWYSKYLAESSFHVLFSALLLPIIAFRKSSFKLSLVTFILFLGTISYFILFYSQFRNHDYYFLAFFPFVVIALLNGIKTLQNISMKPVIHITVKIIFAIIVISGINYSSMKLSNRFITEYDDFSRISFLIDENINEINKLGIEDDSKFIVAPDLCQNGGLFVLDKMGWNIQSTDSITVDIINTYKIKGADYLLLATNDEDALSNGNKSGKLIFGKNEIYIFKLY